MNISILGHPFIRRNARLLIAAGGLAALALAWIGYGQPIVETQALLRQQKQLQTSVAKTAGALRSLSGSGTRLLPPEKEIPDLFKRLYALAEQTHVRVADFSPRPVVPGTADQPAMLAVDFQMDAGYPAIGDFLGRLTTEPEFGIVAVRRLEMVPDSQKTGSLRVTLSLEFCLKSNGNG